MTHQLIVSPPEKREIQAATAEIWANKKYGISIFHYLLLPMIDNYIILSRNWYINDLMSIKYAWDFGLFVFNIQFSLFVIVILCVLLLLGKAISELKLKLYDQNVQSLPSVFYSAWFSHIELCPLHDHISFITNYLRKATCFQSNFSTIDWITTWFLRLSRRPILKKGHDAYFSSCNSVYQ